MITYPETDGKPMAESEVHRDELIRDIQTLQHHFADDPDVYVGGNLLLYYEEGNPRASIAPDVFVVKGVPKGPRRRVYLLWEEGVAPVFVLELTSRSTRREDRVRKRALYARLGVREYFLFDPLAEYLRPPLQGFRLEDGEYAPIESDADGALLSEELGLRLIAQGDRLQFFDRYTGARLLSPEERAAGEAEARRQAETRAAAEAEARRQAEARIAELERLLRERSPPTNGGPA